MSEVRVHYPRVACPKVRHPALISEFKINALTQSCVAAVGMAGKKRVQLKAKKNQN